MTVEIDGDYTVTTLDNGTSVRELTNYYEPSLEEKKALKIKKIEIAFEQKRQDARTEKQGERETWKWQEEEYNAFMLDNNAPTPNIDDLIKGDNEVGNNITKDQLMKKIGKNIVKYKSKTSVLTGNQHGLMRLAAKATNETKLEEVTW